MSQDTLLATRRIVPFSSCDEEQSFRLPVDLASIKSNERACRETKKPLRLKISTGAITPPRYVMASADTRLQQSNVQPPNLDTSSDALLIPSLPPAPSNRSSHSDIELLMHFSDAASGTSTSSENDEDYEDGEASSSMKRPRNASWDPRNACAVLEAFAKYHGDEAATKSVDKPPGRGFSIIMWSKIYDLIEWPDHPTSPPYDIPHCRAKFGRIRYSYSTDMQLNIHVLRTIERLGLFRKNHATQGDYAPNVKIASRRKRMHSEQMTMSAVGDKKMSAPEAKRHACPAPDPRDHLLDLSEKVFDARLQIESLPNNFGVTEMLRAAEIARNCAGEMNQLAVLWQSRAHLYGTKSIASHTSATRTQSNV